MPCPNSVWRNSNNTEIHMRWKTQHDFGNPRLLSRIPYSPQYLPGRQLKQPVLHSRGSRLRDEVATRNCCFTYFAARHACSSVLLPRHTNGKPASPANWITWRLLRRLGKLLAGGESLSFVLREFPPSLFRPPPPPQPSVTAFLMIARQDMKSKRLAWKPRSRATHLHKLPKVPRIFPARISQSG